MNYEENENYKGWYEVHKGAFGKIFTDAYADSQEGRVMLTAALNKLSRRDTSGALVILTELGALTEGETDKKPPINGNSSPVSAPIDGSSVKFSFNREPTL